MACGVGGKAITGADRGPLLRRREFHLHNYLRSTADDDELRALAVLVLYMPRWDDQLANHQESTVALLSSNPAAQLFSTLK
jgi:hypothetical protein